MAATRPCVRLFSTRNVVAGRHAVQGAGFETGKNVMSHDASQAGLSEEPQVFVSYSRTDAETVGAIARLLEDAGVTVWRDSDRILGGQYFGEAIVHAIAHSRVLLLMCSPHSFESENVFREGFRSEARPGTRAVPMPRALVEQAKRCCPL